MHFPGSSLSAMIRKGTSNTDKGSHIHAGCILKIILVQSCIPVYGNVTISRSFNIRHMPLYESINTYFFNIVFPLAGKNSTKRTAELIFEESSVIATFPAL